MTEALSLSTIARNDLALTLGRYRAAFRTEVAEAMLDMFRAVAQEGDAASICKALDDARNCMWPELDTRLRTVLRQGQNLDNLCAAVDAEILNEAIGYCKSFSMFCQFMKRSLALSQEDIFQ
ncbi:hypothetical protein RCKICKAPOO_108 [Rhodobacter phage RcKickapoo]|nr:hypothetical protein RCTIPTONUS_104 [Rhodobacter phage RcTiptonus]UUV43849.1 hypothetical protein RCKICKAPOO_108 [Rhodobacter phage RcKickapoo]UUV44475.1 hypothetical protein RCMENCHIE_106 [Rhodobacter phage RcMenchie]